MDETYSLMEFLQALATNTGMREWFTHDPPAALHSVGLDHLSPADVHDALVLVEDNQTADFSRDYDPGSDAIHLPPPPDHDFASPEQAHHAAVHYLNDYVTMTDRSMDPGGGFDQWIDVDSTVASGDGAVAAGGDIHGSTITSGDHDLSAFGSGDPTGAFASGDSDHSPYGAGDSWTADPVLDSFPDAGDHGVPGDTPVDAGPHASFDDVSDGHLAIDDGQHHVDDVDLH